MAANVCLDQVADIAAHCLPKNIIKLYNAVAWSWARIKRIVWWKVRYLLWQTQASSHSTLQLISTETRSVVVNTWLTATEELTVCCKTFLFLRKSYIDDSLLPRVHGNTKHLPKHALTFEDVSHVVLFINNYSEDHAILLPGRIQGINAQTIHRCSCFMYRYPHFTVQYLL